MRKGGPNVVLRVNPSKGCGDGLVEAVVSTRNGQGVAAKGLLCINYGSSYDLSTKRDDEEQEVKKVLRGSGQVF